MKSKKCVCWEDDFLFDEFHSFFCRFSFSKGEILKKSWTLQWLVSAYFLFPFQPLHFGGGDVVQIGASCFFFEVTCSVLIHFIAFIMIDHAHHKLHHTAEKTAPDKLGLQMICFHVKTMSEGHPKRSDRLDSSSPAETSFAFFSSTTGPRFRKKIRCQRGGPIG